MRKLIGKMIEWFLGYSHTVKIVGREPTQTYKGDAGYDLYCSQDTTIPPHTSVNVPSDLFVQSDDPLWFNLVARSSTMRKRGLQVVEAVIDNDYTGELFACVYNPSDEEKHILIGERVVQIVPMRLIKCRFKQVKVLSPRARGDGGFGSTGK